MEIGKGLERKNYFQHRGVPCLEYRYRAKAAVGDQETGFIEMNDPIMIKSDLPADYVVSNLDIREFSEGANLSWDHNICVRSYRTRSVPLWELIRCVMSSKSLLTE